MNLYYPKHCEGRQNKKKEKKKSRVCPSEIYIMKIHRLWPKRPIYVFCRSLLNIYLGTYY